MDYEKKYKETIEKLRSVYKDYDTVSCLIDVKDLLAILFPELRESEDEKLRKQLLNWFKDCDWDSIDDGNLKRVDIITWLEKQGERNNIVEQLTAFAQHLNKRGAFRDDLCMDFEHEAQSFIESQLNDRI